MHGKSLLNHILCGLYFISAFTFAQAQKVEGNITVLTSEADVGRPFRVKMEIFHPEDVPVIFPDSSFGLGGFEYIRQTLTPTHTDEYRSNDETIFELYTWDIATAQPIQFPFKYIVDGDTLAGLSNTDTLRVSQQIANLPDSLSLKMSAGLLEIEEPFNTGLFFLIMGILIVLITGAVILLWKPARKMLRRWQIDREWKKVMEQLAAVRPTIHQQPVYISSLNAVWKGYLRKKSDKKLRSLTTTELQDELAGEEFRHFDKDEIQKLLEASAANDRILYAESSIEESYLNRLYNEIQDILKKEYLRKKSEVEV